MNGFTRVVTNAGSLQVGDLVFEHQEKVIEIYKQTHDECFCRLQWTKWPGVGSRRYHVINSVNGLVLVTAGPTLDAANAVDGELPKRGGDGLPIYWREHWHKDTPKAQTPRIEVKFVRFSPFDNIYEPHEGEAMERYIAQKIEFTALLNDGWRVAYEAVDMETHQYLARLEREAANS